MVRKTGFWSAPDGTALYWIRDNRSVKRDECWELTVKDGECGPVFVWTERRDLLQGVGVAGLTALLRGKGWTITQQPNGVTRRTAAPIRLPYPSPMVNGSKDCGGWEYDDGGDRNRDGDYYAPHARSWSIDAAELDADSYKDVDAMHLKGMTDGWTISDMVEMALMDDDDAENGTRAVTSHAAAEPAATTQEIPEVPPATNADAVVYATVPTMVRARDIPEMRGMGRIRQFRTGTGRKAAYVAAHDGRCVIAYRDRYKRGSDAAMESKVRDYVAGLGYEIAA